MAGSGIAFFSHNEGTFLTQNLELVAGRSCLGEHADHLWQYK